ncbi:ribonuclease H-like protein [Pseudohyphozyma bogoriensis]|nr:ribonuclease H-like protein [Pseudohyphozyma bogoriensis]
MPQLPTYTDPNGDTYSLRQKAVSLEQGGEGVRDRKFWLCPRMAEKETSELFGECSRCEAFFVACCIGDRSERGALGCHCYPAVFVDGAAPGNGSVSARAGIGAAYGPYKEQQFSLPVDDELDLGQPRTNQRAELLAAIHGLRLLTQAEHCPTPHDDTNPALLIVTDSAYVVTGMTEWFPRWKRNSWITSKGTRPTNLDLFQTLDREITQLENVGRKVGFWHVDRQYNTIADGLAKDGAEQAQPLQQQRRVGFSGLVRSVPASQRETVRFSGLLRAVESVSL